MYKKFFKRIFDIVSSAVGLILLSPVLLLNPALSDKRWVMIVGIDKR